MSYFVLVLEFIEDCKKRNCEYFYKNRHVQYYIYRIFSNVLHFAHIHQFVEYIPNIWILNRFKISICRDWEGYKQSYSKLSCNNKLKSLFIMSKPKTVRLKSIGILEWMTDIKACKFKTSSIQMRNHLSGFLLSLVRNTYLEWAVMSAQRKYHWFRRVQREYLPIPN